MIKYLSTAAIVVTLLTGCGGSDNDDKASSSASSTPASSAPASSTPASSTPASSTPASSMPASSMPASSMAASSTPASSTPASSEAASSSSAPAEFDGTFTNANSIDFWTVGGTWQAVGTATKTHSEGALIVTPTWVDPAKDGFEVFTTLAAPMDLTGATISFYVYMPEAYITDGKLAMQLFFKESDGTYANGGWTQAGYGPWRWYGSETSTTNTDASTGNQYGWVTLEYVISAAGIKFSDSTEAAAWGYNPDQIDITQIGTVGLAIESNGKPIEVMGNIRLDNVVLPGL